MFIQQVVKHLPRLVQDGLITSDQAKAIQQRYAPEGQSRERQFAIFAILGGGLIGLGLVLVIAHNWDDLPRMARTVLAFVPLLIGQALVYYALRKQAGKIGWNEGTSLFLAFAVAACVALIAQIYQVGGTLEGYLLTCSLLILGLTYVPGSSMVLLLYLSGITGYACLHRIEGADTFPWLWIPLFVAAVPAWWRITADVDRPISAGWTSAFMALAFGTGMHLFYDDVHSLIILGWSGLAGAYCLMPWLLPGRESAARAIARIGALSILWMLFVLSYDEAWSELADNSTSELGMNVVPLLVLVTLGGIAYALAWPRRRPLEGSPMPEVMPLMLVLVLIALASATVATVLTNIVLLLLGIYIIRNGSEQGSLKRINAGLGIIALLIMMRFFELDISYLLRGVVFMALGVAFLMVNLRMMKKKEKA